MKDSFHDVKTDAYGVRAVERAVDVLVALADSDQPQTLSAIAARARLSVPTTFRLVRTLHERGLVMSNGDLGRYTLGLRVLELAHALNRQLDIISVSRPFLVAVRDEVNETTGLTVRTGDHWAHAAHAEALQPVRRVMEIGERAPLYAGCVGKVFLAAASDDEVDAYLSRTTFLLLSPTTPTDGSVLRKQIATVRTQGFAESINERGFGGAGAAAPIRTHDGRVVAALEISGPADRYTAETRARWIAAVTEGAARISSALGYRTANTTTRAEGRTAGQRKRTSVAAPGSGVREPASVLSRER
jgi:DNA-binding IclR family transcriptional regulator